MDLNIDELTVGQLKEITRLAGCTAKARKGKSVPLPFKPGDAVIFRTVTMIDLGKVVSIGRDFVVLTDGGWVASTGRFSEMLKSGTLDEFERCDLPWFLVGRGAICDAFPWIHPMPKATK